MIFVGRPGYVFWTGKAIEDPAFFLPIFETCSTRYNAGYSTEQKLRSEEWALYSKGKQLLSELHTYSFPAKKEWDTKELAASRKALKKFKSQEKIAEKEQRRRTYDLAATTSVFNICTASRWQWYSLPNSSNRNKYGLIITCWRWERLWFSDYKAALCHVWYLWWQLLGGNVKWFNAVN